ncbi:Chromosome II, complete genome, related, partial [Eimeria tenella]
LVQVALPELPCLLYDMFKLPAAALQGLLLLLQSPLVTKVMHHAKFDLSFLSNFLLTLQQQQQQQQQGACRFAAAESASSCAGPGSSTTSATNSSGESSDSSSSTDSSSTDSSRSTDTSSSSRDTTTNSRSSSDNNNTNSDTTSSSSSSSHDTTTSSSSSSSSSSSRANAKVVAGVLGGVSPPVFDSLLASRLLEAAEIQRGFSLAQVVERTLGLFLDKRMQSSNWDSQQLHEEQLLYAARDAAVLLPLHDRLSRRLKQHQLLRVADLEHRTLPAGKHLKP